MENVNKGAITIKTKGANISVPAGVEGLMDVVNTPMSELSGQVVLVATHGYHFKQHGHTAYVSSQDEVDGLLKQIQRCDCQGCSDFRMQRDIRQRRASCV